MAKQSRRIVSGRQQKILKYLQTHQSANINELSSLLDVSAITIRRDLELFEQKKIIERVHGGARILRPLEKDIVFEEKGTLNIDSKIAIAQRAVSMIENGDTVLLNSGSTTLLVLKYLKEKTVRVITNNALAPTVVNEGNIELIITGGEFRARSKSLIGEFATNIINKVYANKCVLGANGFDCESGITTSNYQETLINDVMVGRLKGKCIVVADGSKIGKSSNFQSVDINRINVLITDSSAPSDELEKIRDRGVDVVVIEKQD